MPPRPASTWSTSAGSTSHRSTHDLNFDAENLTIVANLNKRSQKPIPASLFNTAIRDLTEIVQRISMFEARATSGEESFVTDLCFVHRCRVIKSELDSLLLRLPNRMGMECKPEDQEIITMLALQIGRLRSWTSVEPRDNVSRGPPNFMISSEEADASMAHFAATAYDRNLRMSSNVPKFAKARLQETWERMHFKYPGCPCLQCGGFQMSPVTQARNKTRTLRSGFVALGAAAMTLSKRERKEGGAE